MKCSEIVNYIMEQRALRKQANNVSVGDRKPVSNRSMKGKERKPYMKPVWVTFELPRREILMGDTQAPEK